MEMVRPMISSQLTRTWIGGDGIQRRDAHPLNHSRMVIFDSPREAAVAAHPNTRTDRFHFEISWATTNSVATALRIHPRGPRFVKSIRPQR
jgi:hypothetical protein